MLTMLASEVKASAAPSLGTHLERWAPTVVGSAVVLLTLLLPPTLFCISWLYWRVQQMHSQQQQQVGALSLLSLYGVRTSLPGHSGACEHGYFSRQG